MYDWHRWKGSKPANLCFGARQTLTHLQLNNTDSWKRGLKGGRCYKARYSKQVLIRPYVLCMNLCLCDRIDARPCWNWSCMLHAKNFLSHVSYLTVNVEDDNFFVLMTSALFVLERSFELLSSYFSCFLMLEVIYKVYRPWILDDRMYISTRNENWLTWLYIFFIITKEMAFIIIFNRNPFKQFPLLTKR